jgi:hypothetical protein
MCLPHQVFHSLFPGYHQQQSQPSGSSILNAAPGQSGHVTRSAILEITDVSFKFILKGQVEMFRVAKVEVDFTINEFMSTQGPPPASSRNLRFPRGDLSGGRLFNGRVASDPAASASASASGNVNSLGPVLQSRGSTEERSGIVFV